MSGAQTIRPNEIDGLVTVTIKIDGNAVPQHYGILSVAMVREVNKIPSCNISIIDGSSAAQDFPASNDSLFIPGKLLEFWAGYNSKESLLFKGIIVRHSLKIRDAGTPTLVIEAKDECFKLTQELHSNFFTEKKDNEIIEDILSAYKIDNEIASSAFSMRQVLQYYSTDWDFIQTRAEVNGQLCFVENGKLIIKKPVTSKPVLELAYGATILEFDAELDARTQYKGVDAKAWSHADQSVTTTSGSEPSLPVSGNISEADLAKTVYDNNFILQHGATLAEDSLQSWADAALLKSRLAKVRGRVKCTGFAAVMPGNVISLAGVGERFNGEVFVSGVRHEIHRGNWTTDIQFGMSPHWFAKQNDITHLPAAGMLPGVKGLQIGIVTDLTDPDGEFRVKIKIPSVTVSEEGIWARMIAADAGKDRGMFFRPEIDDEVIIGFLHEDPNNPIVLGGVFSSAKPSPIAQEDANNEKGIFTRSGMKCIWNDEKKSMLVETPAGKKILVDEDAGELSLSDEHGNKILMNSDGITIESGKAINIKAATDLKMEGMNSELGSSVSTKVKASATLELSSSATATLKGAIVQIN